MSRWIKIVFAAALAMSLAGFVVACGGKEDLGSIDEGQSFSLNGARWNVLYDRFLNPAQAEDSEYVKGLPPAPAGKSYYGVFVIVKNDGDDPVVMPQRGDFSMTDTINDTYTPVDNSATDYGFPYGEPLDTDTQIPDLDSIAAAGPTQGSLLLFLIDQNVTESRPLLLHIKNQGAEEATIKLDV